MDQDSTPGAGECIYTASGRTLDELNIASVLAGELTTEDFRISAETLRCQADMARAAGYSQLAANLSRAAELTRLSNEQVLDIYNTLRPGRTTYNQLLALADQLEHDLDAPLTAALVREAAEVYLARGIIKLGS
jgi:propanediol dehydratase small subunit